MKRVIYIGIAVFALGLASCSKQDFQPNSSTNDPQVPVWKSNDGGITDPQLGGGDDGGITDPNNDPELESSGS